MQQVGWTNEEINDLKNNYDYYFENKEEAERRFKRTWHNIKVKACRIGIKLKQFDKSNQKIYIISDFINGLMLSDGNIHQYAKNTARYSQSCKYEEWLEKIKEKFNSLDIKCNIRNKIPIHSFGKTYYTNTLSTGTYVKFRELKEKWYVEDKKIVPNDIKLTPECVANWYMGDGSISKWNGYYHIEISCQGFNKKEVNKLSEMLNTIIDIKSHILESHGTIQIKQKESISRFLNYIKNYKTSCYNYKFPSEILE